MALQLERTYRFSASHLYRRPEWSEEENWRRFGKCSRTPGHGHNYRVTLTVAGEVDPQTGFLVDLARLDGLVRERVLEPLDHRHLNEAVPEFGEGRSLPTSENLALWIRDRVRTGLPGEIRLVAVRVAEEDDLAAEWRADPLQIEA